MKTTCFLVLLLLMSTFLFSQSLQIFDASDLRPIADILLFNNDTIISELSDENGNVLLDRYDENEEIIFQHPTYIRFVTTKKKLRESGFKIYLKRKVYELDELIFSVSRINESIHNQPFKTDIILLDGIQQKFESTSADILSSTGNIMVQKSQGGGGSPIIRGFEANKLLLVIDGVRMNNAIYRSGHLQNAITVDNTILERAEIVYGPSSVMYGSDAIGGVIHYFTKNPELTIEKPFQLKASANMKYATINKSESVHVNINVGAKKIAFLTGFTYKNFGDIKIGRNRKGIDDDNFGLLNHYVRQFGGKDSTIENKNPEIQLNTGYSQYDFLQKIRYKPTSYFEAILNVQYSTSSDIPRFDQLNNYKVYNPDKNQYEMKYAEWYYGPQDRLMIALKTIFTNANRLYTNMTMTAAYQEIDEDRITRKFNSGKLMAQLEKVFVLSLNVDFFKLLKSQNRLNYGFELNHNTVNSTAFYRNIFSGEKSAVQTRYPDEGSHTNNFSMYINHKWEIGQKAIVNTGIRYSYTNCFSRFLDSSFVSLPFTKIEFETGAVSGSVGFVYKPSANWQINVVASSGFRTPNVDDYGKIRAKNGLITVPNNELSPEYAYNVEIGISRKIGNLLELGGTCYYTLLTDAIVRQEYSLNSSDSLLYDGDYYIITTNANSDKATINGFSLFLRLIADFGTSQNTHKIQFYSTLNYTYGHDISNDVPLGHIPPLFGQTKIQYTLDRFNANIISSYSRKKSVENMSPYGEDNENEGLEWGFPAWLTVNVSTGYSLNNYISVQMAVNNIFDRYYKVFASGVSAAGRNFIIRLQIEF